jgi:DNA-binding response OmpR family regulator
MDNKKRIRIVIVEDDDVLSSLYDEALTRLGFSVGVAKTGKDGIALVKENQPDLVILDIIMPDGDGFFVLRQIKEDSETKDIPVIMHTNLFNDSDKSEAMKLGAVDYVVKANMTPSQLAQIAKKYVKAT